MKVIKHQWTFPIMLTAVWIDFILVSVLVSVIFSQTFITYLIFHSFVPLELNHQGDETPFPVSSNQIFSLVTAVGQLWDRQVRCTLRLHSAFSAILMPFYFHNESVVWLPLIRKADNRMHLSVYPVLVSSLLVSDEVSPQSQLLASSFLFQTWNDTLKDWQTTLRLTAADLTFRNGDKGVQRSAQNK